MKRSKLHFGFSKYGRIWYAVILIDFITLLHDVRPVRIFNVTAIPEDLKIKTMAGSLFYSR